ncbi:MAG: protein-L-isoaspartate(D-aspartate) O-methyltransferase [Wenzhouxiangellaceae bacterium]
MNVRHSSRGIGMTSERTRTRLVDTLRAEGIEHPDVLAAIRATPRHLFVDEALSSRAYENSALPIGRGQTISQPYVVARMTEAALAAPSRGKVLEIGTGSGYQAAVLSMLFDQVFSVERIGELARLARQRFHALKIRNVFVRHADGLLGWPSQAPFDAIVVTAGGQLPETLFEQLAPGGVLVAPVGQPGTPQRLMRYTRRDDGVDAEDLGGVIFVPLLPGLEK